MQEISSYINGQEKKSVWEANVGESLFTQLFDSWKRTEWNEDIPKYFKRLNKIRNERAFVILAASVLEYQLDRFLKCFIPEPQVLINDNTSFDFKIKILRAFKLIPPQLIYFTDLVKNIRNEFAHNQDIDRFREAKKSEKLPKHLALMDKYWNEYESDMIYFKIDATTLQKFKDIWRKALEGMRLYENTVKLFRHETEKPEFIQMLNELSIQLAKDRKELEHNQVMKYYMPWLNK